MKSHGLTDIVNAIEQRLSHPMIEAVSAVVPIGLSLIDPIGGAISGAGREIAIRVNDFKLCKLLEGISSEKNLEMRMNELYNYVNSSPEKAISVANLFKQTINAESPKACVIYGLILASHLDTCTEFTHDEIIVCKALENATDYDLEMFKQIMDECIEQTVSRRRVAKKDFGSIDAFTTTCDWCVYNRIFMLRPPSWEEMKPHVAEINLYYYVATPADVLLRFIERAKQIWNYDKT